MKRLLAVSLLALTLCGCAGTNSNVGPGLLRLGVSTSSAYAMSRYPESVPGVKAGASVVCSVASGEDLSPDRLVDALNAYGVKQPEAIFILRAAVGAYTLAFNGLSDTNKALPYLQATCDGLNDALVMSPAERSLTVKRNAFPQVRFPN